MKIQKNNILFSYVVFKSMVEMDVTKYQGQVSHLVLIFHSAIIDLL